MYRLALGIEYDGTHYNGWQRQLGGVPSIQGKLEESLSVVANHPVSTVCAGRTDSGVHATCQIVHCDVSVKRSEREWVFGCNANLPDDIRVLWAKVVPASFDARFSAHQRRYRYFIYNHHIRPGLLEKQVTWHYRPLNVDDMNQAAQCWLGAHDFSSFRAAECQSRTPKREIYSISVKREGKLIVFDIIANAFLHHMIRNMVGVLLAIGHGKRAIAWAKEVLLAKDRKEGGVTAPPNGLYLVDVQYPSDFELPSTTVGPWFFR